MPLYLIACLGGERVALAAHQVGSVVELGPVTPVPRVAPHVAGLCALRSRVLTVIDVHAALGLPSLDPPPATAVICDIDGHGYALTLEAVEDVVEAGAPAPCPATLAPHWAASSLGLVEIEGKSLLLLDPVRLVDGPAVSAAA
jgi:purine-binding chemotaxis protein CheW